MISGALLLAPSHRNTISGFLKKRLLKIVPSYLAWALIYFAWRIYIEEEDLTWTVFPGELAAGSVYYHLWFLNMLLELYLLVPFLRILVEFTPKAVLIYGLGLWLIWFFFRVHASAYLWTGSVFELCRIYRLFYSRPSTFQCALERTRTGLGFHQLGSCGQLGGIFSVSCRPRTREDFIGGDWGPKFKANGVHFLVLGSPGVVDSDTYKEGNPEEYNKTLAALGNIVKEIARANGAGYADVHGIMSDVMKKAKAKYGASYALAGEDGVHPDENGQLVMAYAFLKAMGCSGDLGTITLDQIV